MPHTIKPQLFYSMQKITELKLFPWYKSRWAVRKTILNDQKHNNILHPIVKGRGCGKKYYIRGENIIKFINMVETGKINL